MNGNGVKDPYRIRKTALYVTRWIGSPASIAVHTVLFVLSFAAVATGWLHFDRMLLILTTIVSLEAIYLAIFIQMTINYTTHELAEVSEDIEEIQENIGEIQEDVEEMSEEEETEEMAEERRKMDQKQALTEIHSDLRKLAGDIAKLQKNQLPPHS